MFKNIIDELKKEAATLEGVAETVIKAEAPAAEALAEKAVEEAITLSVPPGQLAAAKAAIGMLRAEIPAGSHLHAAVEVLATLVGLPSA